MRISLDQPTFLTSLTEEKPANNQTDNGASSDDFLDFSSTLVNQGAESDPSPAASLPSTPVLTDETSAPQNNELTPEDLSNLLLGMGYLSEMATKNAPMANETSNQDQPLDLTKEVMNLETTTPLVASATITNNKDVMLSQKESKPVTTTASATPLQTLASTPSLSTTPLTPETPTTPITNAANSPTQPMPIEKKALEWRKDAKELTKPADMLINAAVLNETKSDSSVKTKATPDFLPTNTDNTPEQKVVMSLQQMAAWVQAKVNAEPALTKGMTEASTQARFAMMQSESPAGGAATPAKAAWEAKVEVNQVMSNAALNLTTYHANIKIYPPELGKITAKLKMDRNETNLEITAENKQVKALLQGHLTTLREQFTNSNIQLNKIEIVLAEPKESNTANPDGRREKEETSETVAAEPNDTKAPKAKTSKKTSENVVDAYV
jgi:flagellar hook-length control protein FliK